MHPAVQRSPSFRREIVARANARHAVAGACLDPMEGPVPDQRLHQGGQAAQLPCDQTLSSTDDQTDGTCLFAANHAVRMHRAEPCGTPNVGPSTFLTMEAAMRSIGFVALGVALLAGAAHAQTTVTREITNEPVETIITRSPTGTVVPRWPAATTFAAPLRYAPAAAESVVNEPMLAPPTTFV